MRKIRHISAAAIAVLLCACASVLHGPDRPPTAAEIYGTYDMGHSGFEESLTLHPDGTYTRTLYGHLGQDDRSFSGTWRMEGKYIFFLPVPDRPTSSSLVQAEAFFHQRAPAFSRVQDLKGGKVHEWWLYQRRGDGK